MEESSALQSYAGNCHCGLFRFTLKSLELTTVRTCNCSICSRNAYMWIWPVAEENLIISTGEGMLSSYEFGNKSMKHFFCPVCGSSIMGQRDPAPPGRAISINARMLNSIDLSTLEKQLFDGESLDPFYEPPVIRWPRILRHNPGSPFKTYIGACHCGAVTYTALTWPPISSQKVISCNCSICSRNGELYIYPPASDVELHGKENLTEYAYVAPETLHSFCKICGVSIGVRVEGQNLFPINVRTLVDQIEISDLQIQEYDGRSRDPQYVVGGSPAEWVII